MLRMPGVVLVLFFAGCSNEPKVKAVEVATERPTHARPSPTPGSEDSDTPPPGGPFVDLDWQTLRGLDLRTGQTTALIELAAGANVRIAGYLVPFDDGTEEASEFLVVPSAGMCVHTPPPPANQMVLAKAANSNGRPQKMVTGAVWVYGKFDVDSGASPYGDTAYRITAEAIRTYR